MTNDLTNKENLLLKSEGIEKLNIYEELALLKKRDNPDEAISLCQDALEYINDIDFSSHEEKLSYKARFNRFYGDSLFYQNHYKQAEVYYVTAIQLFNEVKDELRASEVMVSLGVVYINQERYGEAIDKILAAVAILSNSDNKKTLANALSNAGYVYSVLSDYDKALEYMFDASRIYEELEDQDGQAKMYMNIGALYGIMDKHKKTLEYTKKALKIYMDMDDKVNIASSLNNAAVALTKMNDYDKAIKFNLKALEFRQELNDEAGLSSLYNNIGMLYSMKKDYKESVDYYNESIKIKKKLGKEYDSIMTYINIAVDRLELSEYEKAKKDIDNAISIARKIGNRDLESKAVYELSRIFYKSGEFKKAYDTYCDYDRLKSDIYDRDTANVIAELETRYETERKGKEAEIYKLKNIDLVNAYEKLSKAQAEVLELERKNSVAAMAVTANHELNQPLMVISGNLHIVKRISSKFDIDEDFNKAISSIDKSVKKMANILDKFTQTEEFSILDYTQSSKMVVFNEENDKKKDPRDDFLYR